ncbi:MAG: hypothetical protein IJT21_00585 [Synergistaceae bacterium]|nr:hypothetical protein [Synergistaceae bacterium]
MKELLSENFSQIRSILQEVESITHFTDDENMLKSRHPDWQVGLNINDLKERDKQLKQTFEAYLKTLNTTAKDFKNDEKTRNKLLTAFSTVKVISVLLPLMLLNGLFTSEFSSGLCQVQAWLRSFLN